MSNCQLLSIPDIFIGFKPTQSFEYYFDFFFAFYYAQNTLLFALVTFKVFEVFDPLSGQPVSSEDDAAAHVASGV